MNKRRKLLYIVIVIIIVSYFSYNYIYQDHRDIKTETAKVDITAKELLEMFKEDESPGVLNSTVQVFGIISELDSHSIMIDGSVHCSFDEEVQGVNLNDRIKIKGRCIGYDDLFDIVKIDQSTIIK